MVLGGAISEKILWGGEFFIATPVSLHLDCCVECSVHFLFIFLSSLCGISLKKLLQYEILSVGGPWFPGPLLDLHLTVARSAYFLMTINGSKTKYIIHVISCTEVLHMC